MDQLKRQERQSAGEGRTEDTEEEERKRRDARCKMRGKGRLAATRFCLCFVESLSDILRGERVLGIRKLV